MNAGHSRGAPAAPRAGALLTDILPLERLAQAAEEWRGLAARALVPNVFYDPRFALAAAPVFGRDVFALTVRSPVEGLVALMPCRVLPRRYGLPWPVLSVWTHPFAPFGAPLLARSCAGEALDAAFERIAEDPALPKLLLMPMLAGDDALAPVLDAAISRRGAPSKIFGAHRRALLAPGAARVGYFDHFSRRRRKSLRRQRRRLSDHGNLLATHASGPEDIASALEDFLRLEAKGWKGRAGTAAMQDPAVAHFMRAALADLAAGGQARIDRLLLSERVIAATITLSSQDNGWFWKTAYDEDFAHDSPGVRMALELSNALLQDEAIARVDSCASAHHPMIDHLWRERLPIADRLISLRPSATLAFAAACGLEQCRRSGIAIARALRDAFKRIAPWRKV